MDEWTYDEAVKECHRRNDEFTARDEFGKRAIPAWNGKEYCILISSDGPLEIYTKRGKGSFTGKDD